MIYSEMWCDQDFFFNVVKNNSYCLKLPPNKYLKTCYLPKQFFSKIILYLSNARIHNCSF